MSGADSGNKGEGVHDLGPIEGRSTSELLQELKADVLALSRAQIELAKAELKETVEQEVRLVAGRLEVDGQSVPEPYLAGPTSSGELDLQLGPAEYLVLGDHRAASTDGRDFGPVGADALVGRVRFAYWPPRRLPRG